MRRVIILVSALFVLSACVPQYNSPNPPRAFKGGENAQVVVDEYGDFQCPACGQAYPIVKQLAEKYGDKVRWNYRHFPLTQIHPFAFNASMAAECANDQGKFWEMHDALYENQAQLSRTDLERYAADIGLDIELYTACFKSRAKAGLVQADMEDGTDLGVNSTPSFFVNGQYIQNWSQLGTAIDQLLGGPAVPSGDGDTMEEEGSSDVETTE